MNLNPFSSPLRGAEAKLNFGEGFVLGSTATTAIILGLAYSLGIELFPN